jgi:hypothetical protein
LKTPQTSISARLRDQFSHPYERTGQYRVEFYSIMTMVYYITNYLPYGLCSLSSFNNNNKLDIIILLMKKEHVCKEAFQFQVIKM